jgi:1-acyl-sn-glycerol-3-phosphate acyltransferase
LIHRYFTEPYKFVAPHRGKLWCRVSRIYMPYHLRRYMGVKRLAFQGLERLQASLDQQAGVVLAGNHCRRADPVVVGLLGVELRRYLYYMVSYHLFKQSRLVGWWLNRIGGFSVWREGADREAIRAAGDVLANAERPLALFPEGTWFRQNDRLGPLQEGLTLIVRHAARQSTRPILIHPVGIKYWFLEDPRPELRRRLQRQERRLGWAPQDTLDLAPRIEKLGNALLAVKEVEYLGQAQTGTLDERINGLATAMVTALEKAHLGRPFEGWLLERVRRLRQSLARKLLDAARDPVAAQHTREALDALLFCENLTAHSLDYVSQRPSLERLSESVERIDETVFDEPERPVGPLGAVARVGPPIDVRAFKAPTGRGERRGVDPLMKQLAESLQTLLDELLEEGPPPEWNCPPRIEPLSAPQIGVAAAASSEPEA